MILTVRPANTLKGHVDLPSSKSYTIRALLIAACGGLSKIVNPSDCDDARVAIRAAQALGAHITRHGRQENIVHISACKKKIKPSRIHVGESGTVLRFLLPLLSLKGDAVKVVGEGTLKSRPNIHLTSALRRMGVDISGRGPQECVPVMIKSGLLRGGKVAIKGTLSSQFISALLIACPFLKEDTLLTIKGRQVVSQAYTKMTCQVLKKTGITIIPRGQRLFYIRGRQKAKGLKNFVVPSDYGLAAFWLAAAALTKSHITLKGCLRDDLIQSDGAVIPLLRRMGARFSKTANRIKISGPFRLRGGNFSLKDCPDIVPIMAVLALFAEGKTRLYDIAHVRTKESDRISDLRRELLKIGAKVKESRNELSVYPVSAYRRNTLLDPHHDHRLAMAFSILGLKLGVRVKDIECTAKSYPKFTADLKSIGASVSRN